MALQLLALVPLLALCPLLSAQGQATNPDMCRRAGGWTAKVTFPSEQETFRVNETVRVRCREEPEAGPFPATCVELRGRGAVWDISAVTCLKTCETPGAWDPRLTFTPNQPFYAPGDALTLGCSEGYRPSPPATQCVTNGSQAIWRDTPACQGVCSTAEKWPPSLSALSAQTEFAAGEKVWATCRQEQYEGDPGWVRCTETAGRVAWDTGNVSCVEKCPKSRVAWPLRLEPNKTFYGQGELVTLSCPAGMEPSQPAISCVRQGSRSVWNATVACLERCPKPRVAWPLRLEPNKPSYGQGELVTLSCPAGLEPSEPAISCVRQGSRSVWNATVACLEQCRAPETQDPRVQFALQQPFYSQGASVTWSCPAGFQTSPPEIRCLRRGSQTTWSGTPACTGVCTRAGNWPPSVSASILRTTFAVGEWVQVTCRPEQYEGSEAWMQCTETAGSVAWDTSRVRCVGEFCHAGGRKGGGFEPRARAPPPRLSTGGSPLASRNGWDAGLCSHTGGQFPSPVPAIRVGALPDPSGPGRGRRPEA